MRAPRGLALMVMLGLTGCVAPPATTTTYNAVPVRDREPVAGGGHRDPVSDYEATIVSLEKSDPESPDLLTARLDYVDFLTDAQSDHRPCRVRLDAAQSQLDRVAASRATQVIFPEGWGRSADAEYRVHAGRADCEVDGARRTLELRAALEAAQRAVEQYRAVFDYPSMVIMQYNAAVTYHTLGEETAALPALEAAIEMDRDLGLRDDAQDNYQLLLRWQHQPSDAAHIATFMQDFPSRSVALRFAWSALDATVSLRDTRRCLLDHQAFRSRAAATLKRHVGATPQGWEVSYSSANFDPGVWPAADGAAETKVVFPPALLQWPGIAVGAEGNLETVSEVDTFATQLTAGTEALILAHAPPHATHALAGEALRTMKAVFAPEVIESEVTESYQLETAMWIGASLSQGVWYQIEAPLVLPGVPRLIVSHQLRFAYTRAVPCGSDPADRSCAEIIVHAIPKEDALEEAIQAVKLPYGQSIRYYSSSTYARIIADPRTLLPRLIDTRRDWYVSFGPGSRDTLLESERMLAQSSYP